MKFVKTILIALAACSLALPTAASADPLPQTGSRSDAAQTGGDAQNHSIQPQTGSRVPVPLPQTGSRSDAAQSGGDAQNHSIQPQTGRRVHVPSDEPSVIEVVRPERTIVRDADQALPLILSGTALVLALAGVGFTLVRTRMAPRPGPSH
jgi:hypothetical protein